MTGLSLASDRTVTAIHRCRGARVGINQHVVMGLASSLIDASLVVVFDSFFSIKLSCLYIENVWQMAIQRVNYTGFI